MEPTTSTSTSASTPPATASSAIASSAIASSASPAAVDSIAGFDVVPAALTGAAGTFDAEADALAQTFAGLGRALATIGRAWGDDAVGTRFGSAYSPAADVVAGNIAALSGGMSRIAAALRSVANAYDGVDADVTAPPARPPSSGTDDPIRTVVPPMSRPLPPVRTAPPSPRLPPHRSTPPIPTPPPPSRRSTPPVPTLPPVRTAPPTPPPPPLPSTRRPSSIPRPSTPTAPTRTRRDVSSGARGHGAGRGGGAAVAQELQ